MILLLCFVAVTSGYSLVRHGQVCNLCIATLEEVKSATTSAEVEKLITDIAIEVCAFVPKSHRDGCSDFVGKIMRDNFSLIREFTEIWGPEDICQMFMLCPKSEVAEMEGKVCTVCTDVVAVVRYLLTDSNLENMIKMYAEAVCSATGPLSPLCKREVGQLVDLVFSEVRTLFDNLKDEDICQTLHLCKQEGTFLPHPPSSLNNAVCDACTATVDEIESVLAMDELEKLLEDITALACSLLPGKPASATCTELTQDFLEEIFYNLKQLLGKYDGTKICGLVHLCKSDVMFSSGLEHLSISPLCDVCEDSLHLTRRFFTDPALEAAISANLKLQCSVTGLFHKKCEQYADAFSGSLFAQVRKTFDQFDDHNTCVLFDFCEDKGNKTTVCDVCLDSFTEVSEFLTGDSLRKLVTDEVDLACRATGLLSKICIEEANKIIGMMFGVVDKVFAVETADVFCSQIHLCPKADLF